MITTTLNRPLFSCIAACALLLAGCEKPRPSDSRLPNRSGNIQVTTSPAAPLDPGCRLILVPHKGDKQLDLQIIEAQNAVARGRTPDVSVERLGWLFVAKARASFDPGFYKLAEQCAVCLESRSPGDPSAMLLRGHVLQNLHRFKDAEPIARKLVETRGAPFDFGLLGDVLIDLGQVDRATAAYQSMMDLRPDSQAFARSGHVRWLKGDLEGAVAAMREAVHAASPRNAESVAWMNTRLAFYEWQSGDTVNPAIDCAAALASQPNYAPALLLRGRMQLAEGAVADALETLRLATAENPLPEPFWMLAEALRDANRVDEAGMAETNLVARGVVDDPRTVALFLGTRGEQTELGLRLAQLELESRADVFTQDAVAWALSANGRHEEAWIFMQRALAEGTQDARLFLHAGVIAARLGRMEATDWLTRARQLERLLLPSERRHLTEATKLIAGVGVGKEFP